MRHRLLPTSLTLLSIAFLTITPCLADFTLSDKNLEKCVNQLAKKKGWDTEKQVLEVVCHNKKIQTSTGIEQFPNITKLSLYKNKINKIDLTGFHQLEHINLAGNQLESIELSAHQELKLLYLFHNPITELSIKDCQKLTTLKANNGQLTRLNLTQTPALKKLYLFDNQLEIIDIDELAELRYLDVRHNPMPDDFYDYLDGLSDLTSLHDGNAEDWE